jgi:hypothetical protein
MWVAPVVKRSVLLVVCCGVGIRAQGVSAHGFLEEGGRVVIVRGVRWRKMARRVVRMMVKRVSWLVRDIARWSFGVIS